MNAVRVYSIYYFLHYLLNIYLRIIEQDMEDEDGSECLLSFIAQLNPAGWIWEGFGYQQAFLKEVRTYCVCFVYTLCSFCDISLGCALIEVLITRFTPLEY